MKLWYLLAKKSHDVLNVHKLDFLVPYFMVFGYKLRTGVRGLEFQLTDALSSFSQP